MKRNLTLTHARIDAPHLADGLFILTRGIEGRGKNRIISQKWSDLTITFACVEPLGVLEQTVLLSLIARAGINGKKLSRNGKSKTGREMHALLEAKNGCENRDGIMVTTSMNEIISDCDLQDSGSAYRAVKKALERLGRVIIELHSDEGEKYPNTLLLNSRSRGEAIDIALNYRIREALISTGFTRISLVERRKLHTDVARLMHAFLSRWIGSRRGEQTIGLDVLATHVWPEGLGTSKDTQYRRRTALRTALDELGAIRAWQIFLKDDMVHVAHGQASNENTRDGSTRIPAKSSENTRETRPGGRGAKSSMKSGAFTGFRQIKPRPVYDLL